MGRVQLEVILPLAGIMLAGYLARRFGAVKAGTSEILNRFVFVVALPALIFGSLTRVSIAEVLYWPFLIALGGGMLATFVLSMLIARFVFPDSLTALTLHSLSSMFSSTGYIGLPLIMLTFGDSALAPAIVGVVLTGAVFLPLGVILAEFDGDRATGKFNLAPLIGIARDPIVLAAVSGLAVSALGVAIPQPLATFCDLLGGAFTPCALFSAGIFLVGCSVEGHGKEIGWLVFAKLIVHPLITWWLAYRVLELEGVYPAIAVLLAALPSGVPVFVLAERYGTFTVRSNAVIVLSTVLSIITLSGLLYFLGL